MSSIILILKMLNEPKVPINMDHVKRFLFRRFSSLVTAT